jgi:putative metal binding uncharacterized protein
LIGPDDNILAEPAARSAFDVADRLYEGRSMFRRRGWVIQPPDFPNLTIAFTDRRGRTRAGVRLNLRNFDFLPPSLVFLDERLVPHRDMTLAPLLRDPEFSHVPPAVRAGTILRVKAGGYVPGNHPFTLRPFLCIRGTWEFHMHPQHADVQWEWLRTEPGYGLQYLIEYARDALLPAAFA